MEQTVGAVAGHNRYRDRMGLGVIGHLTASGAVLLRYHNGIQAANGNGFFHSFFYLLPPCAIKSHGRHRDRFRSGGVRGYMQQRRRPDVPSEGPKGRGYILCSHFIVHQTVQFTMFAGKGRHIQRTVAAHHHGGVPGIAAGREGHIQICGSDRVQIVIHNILPVILGPHIQPPKIAGVVQQIDHFTVGLHRPCIIVLISHPLRAANRNANEWLCSPRRHRAIVGMHRILRL